MKKKIGLIIGLALWAGVIHAQQVVTFPNPTEDQLKGLQYVVSLANDSLLAAGETNFVWTPTTFGHTNVVGDLEVKYQAVLNDYFRQYLEAQSALDTKKDKLDVLRQRIPQLTPEQLDALIASLP